MDDVDRRHPCALALTTARCTSALGAKLARARLLANSVKWQYFLHGRRVLSAGAPGEIRTPDPQIRSLVLYPAELRALMPPPGNRAAEPSDSYRLGVSLASRRRAFGSIIGVNFSLPRAAVLSAAR